MASSPVLNPLSFKTGIVKLVQSGDSVVIRKQPARGPPPEKNISFTSITAPKLARQKTANSEESKDEPYAWEAREFLRKKIVGKEVAFTAEKPPNSGNREYGIVWNGVDPTKDENLTEALVSEGLAKVREGARNQAVLKQLEEQSKSLGKGIWSADAQEHVRDVKWSVDNPKQFVTQHDMKPIKAIIEYVRDGSTVRVLLLPDFVNITLMMSGIRCPAIKQDGTSEPYAEEARFFVESRLLQRDVEVILESVNNNNFVGTILHPKANIAEVLLKEGFAKCVDWSLAVMKSGATQLRAAERYAKENKLRLWKNYQSNAPAILPKDKEFTATVLEIVNGDALNVKLGNGSIKKVFLSSIRPPKEKTSSPEEEAKLKTKGGKQLYSVPWMFEAREFLRKKMIGRKVSIIVDYIQPARESFPEKTCCTVSVAGVNIAEALVAQGLATVVRYKRDDDQRSLAYDKLLEAEVKAAKAGLGINAKKDIPVHRVQEISGSPDKAKKFLPFLKRAKRTEAIVEFVASGARLRLYIPKESVVVTLLLAGINCPRGARPAFNSQPPAAAEPFGEEACTFTREKCLQRDVMVTIEDADKGGNFFGWLWIDNENLSVALVNAGLAAMHFSAETTEFGKQLKHAEDEAKAKRLGLWADYVEQETIVQEEDAPAANYKRETEKVFVTEVTSEGHFYAFNVEKGQKLEGLMEKLRKELEANPPLVGAYVPRRGDMCAAKFSLDDQWYRAKVEKVQGDNVSVFYVDYGNRATVKSAKCASLPSSLASESPFATEYALACIRLPVDEDDQEMALNALREDILNTTLTLNVEMRGTIPIATLFNGETDIGKSLVADGLLLVDQSRNRRLNTLLSEYKTAQESALSQRLNLWKHGDITEDDAREFGAAGR